MSRTTRRPGRLYTASMAVLVGGAILASCSNSPSAAPHHAPRRPTTRSSTTTSSTTTSSTTTTTTPPTPVPTGFSPSSVTFVSADAGWAIGTVPTSTGSALAVVHTTDGGVTWSVSPAPPVGFGAHGTTHAARIRFANAVDGWITTPPSGSTSHFSNTMWWTNDGGATWLQVAVPGGGNIAALEASDSVAQLVTISPATAGVHLYSTPASKEAWTESSTSLPVGAGPVPQADLLLNGRSGWVVVVNRTVIAGARLAQGIWQRWTPPCRGAKGAAAITASSTTNLAAVCNEGVWGPPPAGFTAASWLCTSDDGGNYFAPVGQIASGAIGDNASSAASPPAHPDVVVVGGSGLAATFDGGRTWKTVYTSPSGLGVRVVGFTTAAQGVAIVTGTTSVSTVLMTRNGGATWSPVSF